MTGAAPALPGLDEIRILLAAARRLGGAHGTTLEVCIVSLCLAWEAVGIRLETIDWSAAAAPVPARGGVPRLLHLPPTALAALAKAAGTAGGKGQAVTAGRGRPLTFRDMRLDRIKDRLAEVAPTTIGLPAWNMHGLRAAGVRELTRRGSDPRDVAIALGLHGAGRLGRPRSGTRTSTIELEVAATIIGRWNAILAERTKR